MANVLTNLAADIYKARDIVGREVVGLVSSVRINGGTEAVAKAARAGGIELMRKPVKPAQLRALLAHLLA